MSRKVIGTPTGYNDDGTIKYLLTDKLTGKVVISGTTVADCECACKEPQATRTADVAYETYVDKDEAFYGTVIRLDRHLTMIDGVLQPALYTRYQTGGSRNPEGVVAPKPIKVQMGEGVIAVDGNYFSITDSIGVVGSTGSNGGFPQHAFIHVEADPDTTAHGIAYTTDGAIPSSSSDKKFQVGVGHGFSLDTHEEITEFRAAPINSAGEIDTSLTVNIAVEINNISPDKDEF